MRRFEGHQQGETKGDEALFTESAAVKVSYISLRLSTPLRHNRAIGSHPHNYRHLRQIFYCFGNGISVNVGLQTTTHRPPDTAPWERSTINLNWN
jgi:hypothetical protein